MQRKARLTWKLFEEPHFYEWVSHFVEHDVKDDEDTSQPATVHGLAADLRIALHPLMRNADAPDCLKALRFLVTDFVLCCLRLQAEPVRFQLHWVADGEIVAGRTVAVCVTPQVRKLIIQPDGDVPAGRQGYQIATDAVVVFSQA